MMYEEFLKISGQEISLEQYSEKIEPMYNAMESMTKFEFIDYMMPTIKKMARENATARRAKEIAAQKTVFISDGSRTPNGCYYYGSYAKEVSRDVNISTGKITVKVRDLTDEEAAEARKTFDLYLGYDVDYMTEWQKKDGAAHDTWGHDVIVKWVKR